MISGAFRLVLTVVAVALAAMFIYVLRHYTYFERLSRMMDLFFRHIYFLITLRNSKFSLVDFYEGKVEKDPRAIQLIMAETGEQRTRLQVDELANQVAHWIESLQPEKAQASTNSDVIALMLTNCLDYVSIWMGINKMGAAASLINTNITGQSFLHAVRVSLKDSTKKILIVDASLRASLSQDIETLRTVDGVQVFFWGDGVDCVNVGAIAQCARSRPSKKCRAHVKASDAMLYIFTSGTTGGAPKAAKLSHYRYFMAAQFFPALAKLRKDDVIYCPLPLYHTAAGVLGLGASIGSGCVLVIRKKFSVSAFSPDCLKYKVTGMQYIGELCRYLVNAPANALDAQVRLRFAMGNGMRSEYWGPFEERYHVQEVVEFYAATEGNVALINVMGERGACGYFPPLLSFIYPFLLVKEGESGDVYRDASGKCVIVKRGTGIGASGGDKGLLLSPIQASRVYEGYTDKKDTEKKIITNVRREGDMYFNSGDILVTDSRGFFYFADRGGESFRYRGENVSTSEVSVVFTDLVADVCVYGVELPHGDGKGGMACLTPLPAGVDMQKVVERVCSSLPAYARPLFVRVKNGAGAQVAGGDGGDGGLPVTSTFKHLKGVLAKEGYDPSKVGGDDLYYLSKNKSGDGWNYAPLTAKVYKEEIQTGRVQF